jgi:hypothetical protein
MASKRKFYRTVIQVVVLSETPYSKTDLAQIAEDCDEGNQVGTTTIISDSEEMDAKTTVVLLKEAGSEPGFFALDVHGNDDDDEEDDDEDEDDGIAVRKMKDR